MVIVVEAFGKREDVDGIRVREFLTHAEAARYCKNVLSYGKYWRNAFIVANGNSGWVEDINRDDSGNPMWEEG